MYNVATPILCTIYYLARTMMSGLAWGWMDGVMMKYSHSSKSQKTMLMNSLKMTVRKFIYEILTTLYF